MHNLYPVVCEIVHETTRGAIIGVEVGPKMPDLDPIWTRFSDRVEPDRFYLIIDAVVDPGAPQSGYPIAHKLALMTFLGRFRLKMFITTIGQAICCIAQL